MPAPVADDDVLVVGGAVLRHGRVLAARRTSPPQSAGAWELPGGKVEPGERPADALVRELHEELGCRVRVTSALDGSQPVGPGYRLSVLLAELVEGEPTPREHDAVRWLGPEELGEVTWLPPDQPFLTPLRGLLLAGHRLEGGNVAGAVRIGRTVRRPTGPWTPAVHRLLDHLRRQGLPGVPRVLGTDERGREVLSYLPGRVIDVDQEELSEAQLAALCLWARRLHDAVDGLDDPGPWRFFGVDEVTTFAHNDLAPYNVCFEGERLAGVFDWDLAGPSTALLELAHCAWNAVPLYRPIDAHRAARRLELMAASYGAFTGREILHAVPVRVQLAVDGIRTAVAAGDVGMRNLTAVGEPERTEVALDGLRARMPGLDSALA